RLAAALRPTTKKLGLSLGDRSCLALGLARRNTVVTAERAWAKLKIGVKIDLILWFAKTRTACIFNHLIKRLAARIDDAIHRLRRFQVLALTTDLVCLSALEHLSPRLNGFSIGDHIPRNFSGSGADGSRRAR